MQNLPPVFQSRMARLLGDEAPAFFAALDAPYAAALRLNPLRPAAASAAAPFIEAAVPWEPLGAYVREGTRPGASLAHFSGAFYLQEASAMAAVAALDPRPGESVLDLCAAPGGKTTQIAARMAGKGLLVANEYDAPRARVLAQNLERMGVTNTIAVNARPDALAEKWGARFDAVLCDAPCSGEGMFRREPASRDEWTPGAPGGCARRQAEILHSAAQLVRPGGRLVYSTCTFAPEEDEQQISAFLETHPDFTPEDFALPGVGASEAGMIRLYPHRLRGDGHFCARLRRRGEPSDQASSDETANSFRGGCPTAKGRRTDEAAPLLTLLTAAVGVLPHMPGCTYLQRGEYLYAVPEDASDTSGLSVVRAGLCLCRVVRPASSNPRARKAPEPRVEPDHALAMACGFVPNQSCELSDPDALRYLRGETLSSEGEKGWVLVTHGGLPLGWAKRSDGILKNHLPAGLRRP